MKSVHRRSRARRRLSLEAGFHRYTLAAATAGAAVAAGPSVARADFSGPYALTPPAAGNYTAAGTYGTWMAVFSGGSSSRAINTTTAPAMLTLQENNSFSISDSFLTFTTTVAATGMLTFTYADSITDQTFSAGTPTAAYLVNGTPTVFATATASGTINVPVTAGATFGFRIGVNYADSISLNITQFTASVPEPNIGALVAAGAVGLLGLREVRRRRAAAVA